MCKIMNDEETIVNLEKSFFSPISSLKDILKSLCDHNRHGIAYSSDLTLRLSSWYEGDEKSDDYIGDGNIEIYLFTARQEQLFSQRQDLKTMVYLKIGEAYHGKVKFIDKKDVRFMETIYDENEYLDHYLESIFFLEKLRVDAIVTMAQYKGQGDEYIQCSFDPADEDHKEGYVTLFFWTPAVKEDVIVWVENKKFYGSLVSICNETTERYPKTKKELEENLQKIKQHLDL